MSQNTRIGGIGQSVQYGEWEGEVLADSPDAENDRLEGIFQTGLPIIALDIQVLEPLTENRFIVRAFVSSCSDNQTPYEIREVEGTSELAGQVLVAAFKRAHVRIQLKGASLESEDSLLRVRLGADAD